MQNNESDAKKEDLATVWFRMSIESLEFQERSDSRRRKANLALVGFLILNVLLISVGFILLEVRY